MIQVPHAQPSPLDKQPNVKAARRRSRSDWPDAYDAKIRQAGVKPDGRTVPADDQPVAVRCDFVNPIRARRRSRSHDRLGRGEGAP